jgi:deazaflavin-dependent oxidoreductase (nitroreductase family)
MMAKYSAPPYQPKWILQTQVFLLRHFKGPLTKNLMVLTTTGRKTGCKHSIPINFVRDGDSYIALNLGKHSHWFLNARANPCVTLVIDGRVIEARAAEIPASTPQQIKAVLAVYERERPQMLDSFFGMTTDAPPDELLTIGTRVGFMRFTPASYGVVSRNE